MRNSGSCLLPTGFLSLVIWSPSLCDLCLYLSNKLLSCWRKSQTVLTEPPKIHKALCQHLGPSGLVTVLYLLNVFPRKPFLTFSTLFSHETSSLHNLPFSSFMTGQGQHNCLAQNFSVSSSRFVFQKSIDCYITGCLLSSFLRIIIIFPFWGLALFHVCGCSLDVCSVNHVLSPPIPTLNSIIL